MGFSPLESWRAIVVGPSIDFYVISGSLEKHNTSFGIKKSCQSHRVLSFIITCAGAISFLPNRTAQWNMMGTWKLARKFMAFDFGYLWTIFEGFKYSTVRLMCEKEMLLLIPGEKEAAFFLLQIPISPFLLLLVLSVCVYTCKRRKQYFLLLPFAYNCEWKAHIFFVHRSMHWKAVHLWTQVHQTERLFS